MPRPFTEDERQKFLADKHVGILSVAADDGRPPASVPIWYDYEPGGNIRVNTGAQRRKARLIREAGAVTLAVHREELPYQYVIVEGTVVDATTPSPFEVRAAIAARYLGPEQGRAFAERIDGSASVLFTIRPDRWFTADYSDEL
ncbi:pyridoxamine 5'-phosphate oxidase family protein [Nocardia sp. CDC159]|uniref:Pyridoxamine 5'-phosphate oxidase family protein n=1 Tax=Nocardia pulmonis TaxID=2951408 RepID=A0A9X2E5V3_9NOCA|nr:MULTISPECIES: pyridoxamine 5'-phosphate oxidase family protein [Nocardia]MCM6774216.1 pyridoxamine 5'-phosphate oxidase family protein [Nocardia pulmonis]MCM6787103.1 pyridoxamine 5'-phosphate oxidase family protein [Nocardia sp. CDC159]